VFCVCVRVRVRVHVHTHVHRHGQGHGQGHGHEYGRLVDVALQSLVRHQQSGIGVSPVAPVTD
jgi:hypothetical protein